MRTTLLFFLMFTMCAVSVSQTKPKRRKNKIVATDTIEGIYIPKDIEDCVKQLDELLDDVDKEEISEMSSIEFLESAHFELGLWIRNNWKLWYGSRLSKYLTKKGCKHADGMSDVILKAYYDHLTNLKKE